MTFSLIVWMEYPLCTEQPGKMFVPLPSEVRLLREALPSIDVRRPAWAAVADRLRGHDDDLAAMHVEVILQALTGGEAPRRDDAHDAEAALLADALDELARLHDTYGRGEAMQLAPQVHRLALRLSNRWGWRTVDDDNRPRRIPNDELGPGLAEHVRAATHAYCRIWATYIERKQLETRPRLDVTPDGLRGLAKLLRPVAVEPAHVDAKQQPHLESSKALPAKLPALGPHDMKAWQLSQVAGLTQGKVAEQLNEQLGTTYKQGQISRMIARAKRHAEASGLQGLLPPPAKPGRAMDPRTIDMGRRTDGRRSGQK